MEPETPLEIHSSVLSDYTELLDIVFRMYIEDIKLFFTKA